jgi:hypothetical protein
MSLLFYNNLTLQVCPFLSGCEIRKGLVYYLFR